MGQKVHPFGFRVGVTEAHKSRWFAPKALFGELLIEDYKIRKYVDKRLNRTPPFAAVSDVHIERTRESVLLPHPRMVKRINAMAGEVGADLVVLDPALPLGLVGPSLDLPYDVVLHGAEVTVPGRLPGSRQTLAHVLRRARHVVAAGGYPAAEAERAAGRHAKRRGTIGVLIHRPARGEALHVRGVNVRMSVG